MRLPSWSRESIEKSGAMIAVLIAELLRSRKKGKEALRTSLSTARNWPSLVTRGTVCRPTRSPAPARYGRYIF